MSTISTISAGQTSSGITVDSGVILEVSGTAISITVNKGGIEYVYAGGTAISTTVNSGGADGVSSGGTASFTTVSGGGNEYIGGTAISTTIRSGGVEWLTTPTAATSFTTISSGGVEIARSGTASDTVVDSGGYLVVVPGGNQTGTILSGGSIVSTGVVFDQPDTGATVYSSVASGLVVSGFGLISFEAEYVLSGGTALSTTLTDFADQYVFSGGTASFTSVTDHAIEFLYGGDTFNNTLSGGGGEIVSSGGVASLTTLDSTGELTVDAGGAAISTTVNNAGLLGVESGAASFITLNAGARAEVLENGSASFTTVANSAFFDVISGTAFDTVVSSGGTEVLLSASGVASYSTVFSGGMIDVEFLAFASAGLATVNTSGVLIVSQGGQSYSQQMSPAYSGQSFMITEDESDDVLLTAESAPCFGAGTRILTERGEVAVEELRVGDLVHTVLGFAAAPIIWIGRRRVDCARHRTPRLVWPVRIASGAFGGGRPHSELFLSPDHAVYFDGVLIPIRYLINDDTIARVPVDDVTYYHVELPRHDVVLAQGLPAESFLDMKDGSGYARCRDQVRTWPDVAARTWEAFGCAPLVVTGPRLAAARAAVSRFAAARREEAARDVRMSVDLFGRAVERHQPGFHGDVLVPARDLGAELSHHPFV